MQSPSRSTHPFALLAAAAALVLPPAAALLVSCAGAPPAPQRWSSAHGPLVPHRTFPGDCQICHTTGGWRPLRDDFEFDHAKRTGHALEGAHARAECLRCHNDRGPVQRFVARGCGGCHVDPHESELGAHCESCHDQLGWRPRGMLADHARTRFPLSGAHLALPCDQCHERARVGNFEGAAIQCEVCHARELARATSPDHQANGWTHDCQRCHVPVAWEDARFAHNTFPLTGRHAQIDCKACHTSGFAGTPRECYSCHAQDYAGAKNPDHAANGFPTTCQQCHTTSGWTPATFDHGAFFPIDRGAHKGIDCASCHTTGSFATFSCIDCHAHTKSEMDQRHREVGGYRYNSHACYQCHPQGRGDD